jgi:hypothetical protein
VTHPYLSFDWEGLVPTLEQGVDSTFSTSKEAVHNIAVAIAAEPGWSV